MTKSQELLYYLINSTGLIDDKTKLAKLQYFVDFIHFAFHNKPVSQEDVVYTRERQGPLARHFNSDLTELKKSGYIVENPQYHFTVKKNLTTNFTPEELKTINFVLERYAKLSYAELVDICHNQAPYLSTAPGAVVELFTAYNLVDDYADYTK